MKKLHLALLFPVLFSIVLACSKRPAPPSPTPIPVPSNTNIHVGGPVQTWGGDLVNSTVNNQYLASISGSAGGGGYVPLNISGFKVTTSPLNIEDNGSVIRDSFDTNHGLIIAGGGGTDSSAAIGPLVGLPTAAGALYLLPNGISASGSNFAAYGDGTSVLWNTRGASGTHYFYAANATEYARITSTALQLTSIPTLQWAAGVTSPTMAQVAPTSDVLPSNLTISAQGPWSGASVHQSPASIILNTPAPMGAGSYGQTIIQSGSTTAISLGLYATGSSAAIYFMGATGANFGFLGNTAFTILNSPSGGDMYLQNAGNTMMHLTPGAMVSEEASWQYDVNVTSPTISQAAKTSDVAPQNLTLQAQGPYASAVTHVDAGDVVVNVPASVSGTSKYGGFQLQQSSTPLVRLGTYGSGSTLGAIWFVDGGSEGPANFSFLGNQALTVFNVPTGGGTMYFRTGNNTTDMLQLNATAAQAYINGSTTAASLYVDWTTGTTPKILGGTASTLITIGSNKSGAATELVGDAAANVAKLSTIFEHQTAVFVDAVTAPGPPVSSQRAMYVDSADNKLKVKDNLGNITVLSL